MTRPLISVVIPTYNRIDALRLVLDAYERQVPADLEFEVVVVDDGSTDGSAQAVSARPPGRFPVRLIRQTNSGPAAARNRALELVEADLVLFTGDDIEPRADLLAEHLAGHRRSDDRAVAILGLTRWPEGYPLTATMRHIDGPGAQQFSYHYFSDGQEYDFRHFYTSNVSLRRELLRLEPGGFCTDFPAAAFEDAELAYRLSRHGLRIVYRAAAVAYHHHRYDARTFFRRQVRCGAMAALLYRRHPALKKFLGIGPLQWRRLALLAGDAEWMGRVELVAADIERWERRVVAFVSGFDSSASTVIDTVLHPLFEYGYRSGLADAVFPSGTSSRVRAVEYLGLIPSAVREFERQAMSDGVPVPRGDLDAISSVDRRPIG